MKGKIIFSILDSLEEAAGEFSDLLIAYLNTGYGASVAKLSFELDKAREARLSKKLGEEEEIKEKRKCAKMISYLKESGLIAEKEGIFSITKKGKEKRRRLKEKLLKSLPTVNYPKIKSNQPILISFDIPEKERRKRAWIREVLNYLDFKMVHKSVWVGFVKIPKELIRDFSKIEVIDFVEIIEISRGGTLKKAIRKRVTNFNRE